MAAALQHVRLCLLGSIGVHGPFSRTPWALSSPQSPLGPSSSPSQDPSLKDLSPWSSSGDVPPRLLWVAEERMSHRPQGCTVPGSGPHRHKRIPYFLSSGSCSLQTSAGPTAWPWPSRTSCGGLGATGEPWSHCKCIPRLCCYHSTQGCHSCEQATVGDEDHICVSSQIPVLCPMLGLAQRLSLLCWAALPRPGLRPSPQLGSRLGRGLGLPCPSPGRLRDGTP